MTPAPSPSIEPPLGATLATSTRMYLPRRRTPAIARPTVTARSPAEIDLPSEVKPLTAPPHPLDPPPPQERIEPADDRLYLGELRHRRV